MLFDLDGVLIDSRAAWYEAMRRCRLDLGYPDLCAADFRETFGQGLEADRHRFYPRHSVEQIAACYCRRFAELAAEVAYVDGALDVQRTLHERGLRQAVVTNTPLALARRLLALKGLDRHLDAVAAAGEARDKPAPDLLLLALDRIGVPRHEALYVGDSPSDKEAAAAAGVRMAGLGIAGDITLRSLVELLEWV